MAVSCTNVLQETSAVDASQVVTSPLALVAGNLHLLSVTVRNSVDAAPAQPTVTQVGATWQLVNHLAFSGLPAFNGKRATSVFRCLPTLNVAAASITVSYGVDVMDMFTVVVDEFTDALADTQGNGAATVVQSAAATGVSTSPAVTLSAFASSSNATYAAVAHNDLADITPGTGFSEIVDVTLDSTFNQRHATEFRVENDTSVDASIGASQTWVIIAVEVAAAAAVTPTPGDNLTTVAEAIAECRVDYLLAGHREQRNTLAQNVDASATTLTFTYPLQGIREGARLSIDLEDFHVWAASAESSKQAIVERGDNQTAAVSHLADDIVWVNPRWSDAQILRAMNREMEALSSPSAGLFRIVTKDLTVSPVVEGYEIPSGTNDLLSVWQVRYHSIGPEKDWPLVPRNRWEYVRNAPSSDFPSGHAIFIRGYMDPSQTVRVWFRSRLAPLAALSNNIETVTGLLPSAVDLLPLGAAIRLSVGREIHRNFDETQGNTRRANEVPAGANLQAVGGLVRLRQQRIREEAARLARLYPDRW